MIILHSVKYKNFLSTGNIFTTIPLDSHAHTLIIGDNGSGKSTLLDAVCFGLFNRPFRKITKPSLVNSINGRDCIVEVTLAIDGVRYRVVRGIKPAIFEIYQDDILINQDAESRDYQAYLEGVILKMNYKSFTQIAVLGSASFVPFMQLTNLDRRAIIEDLLDIQIFSTMNTLLKEHVSTNKESLVTNRLLIESSQEKVAIQEKHVATLSANRESVLASLQHDHDRHLTQITDYECQINKAMSEISSLTPTLADRGDLSRRLTTLNKLEAQIQSSLTKQQKALKFFKDYDHCPTCQQNIDTTFREHQLQELGEKIADSMTGIQQLEQKIAELEGKIRTASGVEGAIRQLESNLARWKQSVTEIQTWVESLATKMRHTQTTTISAHDEQQQLQVYEDAVVHLGAQRQTLVTDKQYLDAASVLLKDTGIKTKIVQQYLPVINMLVNKYLSALDFSVNFILNDAFEETFKSRYRDEFQYASFSEGEKQRIDMALMLTWRAVAKLKNSLNINVLILDEVFDSSLDVAGADELLKILTVLEGTNVFVISHRGDVMQDKFQHVLRFRKQHNFSQVIA